MTTRSEPPTAPDPDIDAVLEALFERPEAEWKAGLEKACARFPGNEDTLRKRFDKLREMGFLDEARAPEQGRIGDFRLLRLLGEGGMGVVYLAEQESLGRRVALKLIRSELLRVPRARERFQREALAASRLDHPGICPVYDVGEAEGTPYIAMRYVEGETLARKIAGAITTSIRAGKESPSSGAPSSREDVFSSVRLIEETARAIHAAHEQGLIHRDVKPGNIMITGEGRPVVLDFGLARDDLGEGHTITRTGDPLGTPAYMSPEQVSGDRVKLDRRTDVYSLGVTLYESLTMETPFRAPTREGLYREILTRAPLDPRRLNPALPRDLKVVLETALEKEPDRRYATALALADDLKAVREGKPVAAKPISAFGRGIRWARREPARAALLLVLLVGIPVVAGLGGFLFANLDEFQAAKRQQFRNQVEAVLEEGFLELTEDDPRPALALFESALALDPNAVEAVAGMVTVHLRLRAPDRALAVLNRYQKLEARYPVLKRVRARALRAAGRRDEAIRLEQDLGKPSTALGFFLAGQAAMPPCRSKDREAFGRALDYFTSAVYRSGQARAIYYFAQVHAASHAKNTSMVRRITGATVSLWPGSYKAWRGYAQALSDVGEREGAIEAARKLIRLKPDRAHSHYALGTLLGHTGDLKGAVKALREAIRLRPHYGRAHTNLGNVLSQIGDHEGAIRAYREAIRIEPADPLKWCNLGTELRLAGDLKSADKTYREALQRNPEHPEVLAGFGLVRSDLGDQQGALQALNKAIEIDPYLATPRMNFGLVLQKTKNIDGALKAHREAARLDPNSAVVRANLGNALCESGDLQGAVEAFQEAIRLDPGQSGFYSNLGLVHMKSGNYAGAIEAYRESIRLAPHDVGPLVNLGFALSRTGDTKGALRAYQEALRLDPDHAMVHLNLGVLYSEKMGDLKRAEKACREAIRCDPGYAKAHAHLGLVLLDRGHVAPAVQSFHEAIRLDKNNAMAHGGLGSALGRKGDLAGSVAAFRMAVRLDPELVEAHANLASVLIARGDLKGAMASLQKALQLQPGLADAHFLLGRVRDQSGDLQGAIASYREAVRLRKEHAEAHYFLGHAYRRSGEYNKALASYRQSHALGTRWKQNKWSYPSARWIAECERYVSAESRLEPVLAGRAEAADADEAVVLAKIAYGKKRYGASARLFQRAFEMKAEVKRGSGNLYFAAFCAVLAGCNLGSDAASLDAAARSDWRRQALRWLEEDLARKRASFKRGELTRKTLKRSLTHWVNDPDLAGIRDREGLEALPPAERLSWQELWTAVRSLLDQLEK